MRREPAAVEVDGVPNVEPLRRRKLVFALASIALLMAGIDVTVVATTLTAIQQELDAPIQWIGWTITIYALGQVLVMPVAGRIGDMVGRKRVLIVALAIFTTASILCALAPSIATLIVFRALQSIGGGAFMPSVTGIVSDHFGDGRERAVALLSAVFPLGGVIGPIVGSIAVGFFTWRAAFMLNVPVGIAMILTAIFLIPETGGRVRRSIDFPGIGLLAATVLSTMLAITSLGNPDTTLASPTFWIPAVIGVVMLTLFVWYAFRARAPFIPARLLVGNGFGTMNALNFIYGATALGFFALVPLYAEQRFGIPPLQAGTLLSWRGVGMILFASATATLLHRFGPRPPLFAGFSMVAAGLAAMTWDQPFVDPAIWISIATGITGIGIGMATPAANTAIMRLAPAEIATTAGLRGSIRQAGAITAVSVATAVVGRSDDSARTLTLVFLVFSAVLIASMTLIWRVPGHPARGTAGSAVSPPAS